MDTLIIISILAIIVYGAYRLKKHSDKVRQQMFDEMEDDEQ